jgi:hypothetical protein
MTPLIFLDFDGVLNRTGVTRVGRLEPSLVRTVAALADDTQADVVLSTSWRVVYDKTALAWLLDSMGLPAERVVGQTPDHGFSTRGAEIAAYLNRQNHRGRFVVLDDNDSREFDMGPVRPWLVQTDHYTGVTRVDAVRARQLLLHGPAWTSHANKSHRPAGRDLRPRRRRVA